MAKPPSLMRKLSGASDTVRKESNASEAQPASSEPSERSDAAAGGSSSESAPSVARKEESNSEAPTTKPWEAPAWRAHCAQEREAARQVKPYESDLVDVLGARFGCVASGAERDAPDRPERSDEEMWNATADSLSDLKRACLEYGFSAGGSKESLAARIYHPDQPDPLPAKRRRTAAILERRRGPVE